MTNYKELLINKINDACGANAPYVLKTMEDKLRRIDKYVQEGKDQRFLSFIVNNAYESALKKNEYMLTPATAKVGDGATEYYYSDQHACTIIKVTKKTITIRRDKVTLSPYFHPKFVEGGFACHCINQEDQEWKCEEDPNGYERTYYWSDKYNRYGQPNDIYLGSGRHEFYDYNF